MKKSTKGIGMDAPAMAMSKDEMRYRTEDDMRTITKAHEIMKDTPRMRAVENMMKDSMMAMQKMKGMKKR